MKHRRTDNANVDFEKSLIYVGGAGDNFVLHQHIFPLGRPVGRQSSAEFCICIAFATERQTCYFMHSTVLLPRDARSASAVLLS